MTTAYDFSARDIDGDEQPLATYRGKALLVVNVAVEMRLHAAVRRARGPVPRVPRAGPRRCSASRATSSATRSPATRPRSRTFCSTQLRRDVPDVREDRGQRREHASALSMASRARSRGSARHAKRSSGTSRSSWSTARGDQRPLRADRHAAKIEDDIAGGCCCSSTFRRGLEQAACSFGEGAARGRLRRGGRPAARRPRPVGVAGGSSTGSVFITWRLRPSFVFLPCDVARRSSATSLSIGT